MRQIFYASTIIAFFFNSLNSIAQTPVNAVKPGPKEHFQGTVPQLITKIDLITDLNSSVRFKQIFCDLSKKKVGGTYVLLFTINKKGEIVRCNYSPFENFKEINQFAKTKFIRYRWKAARDRNNVAVDVICKLVIYFDMCKKQVDVSVKVVDAPTLIYNRKITDMRCN